MESREPKVQGCDATDDDSSNTARTILRQGSGRQNWNKVLKFINSIIFVEYPFMNFTKFNLLLTATLIVILYFMIPFYNEWLWGANAKVLNVNNSMLDQMQNLDTSYRKAYRFGGSYLAYQDMKTKLIKAGGSVMLLMPTTDYMKAQGITDMSMCEPSEFYYFTGINSVWANSPEVARANWAVVAAKGRGISLKKIKSKPELDSLINLYKPYVK